MLILEACIFRYTCRPAALCYAHSPQLSCVLLSSQLSSAFTQATAQFRGIQDLPLYC